MQGDAIIVSTQRKLRVGQLDDKSGKGQLLIISDDKGETWGKPTEVQNILPYGYRITKHSCIGSNGSDIIQVGNGTLITDNQGKNWTPYPRAFKFVSREAYGNNSPLINKHPEFGLIFFTGTSAENDTGYVFRSDDGSEWKDTLWHTDAANQLVCPAPSALVLEDGSILMVSSNGSNMVQYFYQYQEGDTWTDIRFTVTEIPEIITSLSAFDVPELIINPVSGNIELLESNPSALLLWSIPPEDIMAGKSSWKFETVLIARMGVSSMHPAGTVIDAESNTQHIFLYIGGEYDDRNCIYQLERTLDTDALASWMNYYWGVLKKSR
jgi:hypothetical protein